MVDTVRTVSELIDSLFAQGQLPRSITEQDVRDMIVSISLETTDLSPLPRSPAGLDKGRLWIDNNNALRIVTDEQPVNSVGFIALSGRGSLFAQGIKPGAQLWTASAGLAGAGNLTGSATSNALPRANFAGIGSVLAQPVRNLRSSGSLSGAGLLSAAVSQQRMRASRTIGGAGHLTADGQRGGTMVWAAGTNVVRENGNLRWRNAFPENTISWVTTTGTTFKTSGKWYCEMFFPPRNSDTRYGIANPSFDAANYAGHDANSWGVFDNFDGTGTDLYNDAESYPGNIAPPAENGVVSIALDCDNWKWWTRLNGGAWSNLSGGTQNPATNQGGAPIPSGLQSGGVSVAGSIDFGTGDYIDMYPSSATWVYSPPSGFVAM